MGELTLLPVPEGHWHWIGIAFMVGLPRSNKGNNCVTMIIDHITKWAHWVAIKEDTSTEEFAWIFIDKYVRLYSVPAQIVSNRDPRFMSDF